MRASYVPGIGPKVLGTELKISHPPGVYILHTRQSINQWEVAEYNEETKWNKDTG